MTVEYRDTDLTWPSLDLSIRALVVPEGDALQGRRFTGYAAVFDSPSEKMSTPLGTFVESIKPGAFTRTLADKRNRIRMFVNHNQDFPLASTRSGTMSLVEDERGLKTESILPDTSLGRDMSILIREGIVDSMSFGFTVPKGGESWDESGQSRTLSEIRLHEVSIVTGWPGYKATSVSVRSLDEIDSDDLAEAWRVLRDPDGRLTSAQRDLIVAALNTRTDTPVVGGRLAYWREIYARSGPPAVPSRVGADG